MCWKLQSLPTVAKSSHSLVSRIAGNSILNRLTEEVEVETPCRRLLPDTLLILNKLRNSPHFMTNKGSLPLSQQPAICPYPGPYEYSPSPLIQFLKIHLNTYLPFAPRSSQLFFTAGFRANLLLGLRISPLPHRPTSSSLTWSICAA